MRELSLFSGAGGGLLGTHLLGWKPIGYVEYDDYCQRVIAARIKDGILPVAPIFTDVCKFIQSGAAEQYRGFADVVTAGFPCQPFSVAGKRAGADDERNMWPATIECIRLVRPKYAFLENVPGLLASGYFGTILADLAQSGYDARWRILSAAELGAPHKRDRLWIVAHATSAGQQARRSDGLGIAERAQRVAHRSDQAADVAHATSQPEREPANEVDALSVGRQAWQEFSRRGQLENTERPHNRPQEIGSQADRADTARPASGIGRPSWWEVEPPLGRVVDGLADRVEQLRAIGNGQVSGVVRAAWRLLGGEL